MIELLHKNIIFDPFAYFTFSHLVKTIKEAFGDQEIEGVEIGTMRGESAYWLMSTLKNIKHLYTVDPYAFVPNSTMEQVRPQEFHDENFQIAKQVLAPLGTRVTIIRDFSDNFFARMKYEGKMFDFVWIDGHHEKFQVDKDIKNAKAVTKVGGLILGHDYENCPGVKAGVQEAFQSNTVRLLKESQIWYVPNA